MSTTKDRTEYFKQYHIANGEKIRARKIEMYTEKRVLNQMDSYLLDKDLLGLTGSIEREKFAAKEIARPIGERTSPCDYQLILDAHRKLDIFFNNGKSTPLEFFTTKPILLAKFYQFCASLPEFDKYEKKLISMYTRIEQQHAADLATVL